jgi:hypothetical protein
VEEVGRAWQGGGQRESLDHGKPQGGLGRPAQRLRQPCGTLAASLIWIRIWRMNGEVVMEPAGQ